MKMKNRDIHFRAKSATPETDGNEWFYGSYYKTAKTTYCFANDCEAHPDNIEHYILFDMMTDWGLPNKKLRVDINPDTLCEYTQMHDKKNQRIYEGSIVQTEYETKEDRFVVVWDDNFAGFIIKGYDILDTLSAQQVEVIGNIIDNPELLLKEDKNEE